MPIKSQLKSQPKLHLSTISLVVILALVLAIFFKVVAFLIEEPIYIAIVTNNQDKHGETLSKGAQLYIDEINQKGGVNGKPIKLLEYDDENNEKKAQQVAKEIVTDNKVFVVLGHNNSNLCFKGGTIYQEAKIPAITASCTADNVTEGNEWYFRIIPNNRLEGTFLATYARKVLKHNTASIIYEQNDDYSISLKEGFEDMFIGLKGKIRYKDKLGIDPQSDNIDEQIHHIVQIFLEKEPELIFIALHLKEATKFIVAMKHQGLSYPILGGDALGQNAFAVSFNNYPEEKVQKGFFSDNIYAVSPLIFDVGNEKVQTFKNKYLTRYQESPSWQAAMAYEATSVAVEALKKANIQGTLTEARQKIRDYLATRTSIKRALQGLNGPFYFDPQGNAVKPLMVGVFKKQQFISALTQFQPVINFNKINNFKNKLEKGHLVIVGGQYMHKTDIVYAGIDFNEVSELDVKKSSYKFNFYLWFRSKEGVKASDIEFINAVSESFKPLKLGEPLTQKIMDGITYQVYRVKGEFRERFNFKDYPFDTQKLAIRFRHTTKTRNDIIYVVDLVGLGEPTGSSITAKLIRNKILGSITDWKIKKVDVFQNISKEESSLGDPKLLGSGSILNYSTFNAVIEIKRDTLSFVIKNLLPLLFLVGISYFLLFLPFEQITATAISGTLVAIAFFHLGLANGLPSGIGYAVALDYAFYLIYGLIILQFLLVVIGQHVSESQLKHVSLTGQIAYPIILLTGICFFVYYYSENGEIALSRDSNVATDSVQLGKQNPKTSHSKTTPEDSVVLTLGSWLSKYVYVEQMNNHILTAFQTKYPHIQIEFQPFLVLEYDSTLDFHFKNQSAPDIVFLRPFSQQYLFEEGYLESLGKVPNIKKNIPLIIHTPWNSNNYLYGVPLMAVSHAIYYNMDIFKELELEVPKTWEELLVTAQTLKKAGYTPFANGLKTSWAAPVSIFMNLAPNFIGGQAGRAEYLSGQRCFNDEQVVAAFQAVVDIAPFLPNNPETINVRASQELFLTGKAAMLMDGSWEIPYFEQKQPHFKWSVFAVPAPAGQPQYVTYHPDFAIGLNKNSPHKEEAMLFLTWLTQPETVKLFSDKLPGFFPLNQKLLPTLQNKHAQAFLDLNQGRGTDIRWVSEKLMDSIPSGYDLMSEGTKAVIRGEKTPQEAANALQDGLAQWFKPAQTCLKK